MIHKNKRTKFIFSSSLKFLILFLVIMGYFLINKTTTYAAAYPWKNTGNFFVYFTDADGTEYGYKVDVNFGNGFIWHNIGPNFEGGSNWGAENISYKVTTILGNDSKKPTILFNYVGNDIPDQTGHFRNVTIYFFIPRTAGASKISFVKMDNVIYTYPGITDLSNSADIVNNLYRTGATFPIEDLGIQIYGNGVADVDYGLDATANAKVYLKTSYDPVTFDLNSFLDGNWNGNLGSWGTADVYINGNLVANDVTDYYNTSVPYGSTYTVCDISAKPGFVYTGPTSYSGTANTAIGITPPFSTAVNFNLNSTLDGFQHDDLGTWGTADVYINGTKVADDTIDFNKNIPYGSTYVIDDIKGKNEYAYIGPSSYTGTVKSTTYLYPPFKSGYTIVYNGNGATSGSMLNSIHTWGKAQKLNENLFKKKGYTFIGWSSNALSFNENTNLATGTAAFNNIDNYGYIANGSAWVTDHGSVVYDSGLFKNEPTIQINVNYMDTGEVGIYQDVPTVIGQVYTVHSNLSAHRSLNRVRISSSDGQVLSEREFNDDYWGGDNANEWIDITQTFVATTNTTRVEFEIIKANDSTNAYFDTLGGFLWLRYWKFELGSKSTPWTDNPASQIWFKDQQSVLNVISKGTQNLYAIWERDSVTFDLQAFFNDTYCSNLSPYGTADVYINGIQVANDVTDYWDNTLLRGDTYEVKDIKVNAGYFYAGESSYSGTLNLDYTEVAPKFADTKIIKYKVVYNANGGGGVMDDSNFNYNTIYKLTTNAFKKSNCLYVEWNTHADGSGTKFANNATVSKLTNVDGEIITLYAQWDNCPIIIGTDSYYTLEDAINGKITEADLIKNVIVTDDKDINLRSLLNITNYDPNEFTQFTSEGSTLIQYQVTDSGGNTSYTTNTVYIVDTTTEVVQENKYVRFISNDYYQKPTEEGGLGINSIWKTSAAYSAVLEQAMLNRRSLVEKTGSMNVFGINYNYTKPGSISRDHMYQSWSFNSEDIEKVKAYITKHGFGNIQEPTALSNFLIEFNYCKK